MSRREDEAALAGYLSARMQEKMKPHSESRVHWRKETFVFLFSRLSEEVQELWEAVMESDLEASAEEVWNEAADVANLAAMVADRYGGMP